MNEQPDWTRREFLIGTGLTAAALGVPARALPRPTAKGGDVERIDCSRKERYWKDARPFPREVTHPLYYTEEEIARARRRIERQDWARRFRDARIRWLDRLDILNKSDEALTRDISDQVNMPLPRCPVDRRPRSWRTNFWEWSADDPDHVRCKICGGVFPGPEHDPTGSLDVIGPAGGTVTYRYWEDEEGIRYFFDNIVLYYRQRAVVRLAQPLALTYALTGDTAYAQKAAVILDRVAQVYPNYPVHGLGVSYLNADKRGLYENQFYQDPPFPFVSARMGNFHASPFSDAGQVFGLTQAYDLILPSGEVDRLSERRGVDVRQRIERDLIYEAARHTLEVPYRPGNYDGSKIRGLALFGRVLGEPSFVAEGFRLYKRLIDNAFHYDGYWHEDTIGYFAMIVGTIVVETVFAWPGIGRLAVESIRFRDFPTVQTVALFFGLMYIGVNLLVDILYAYINPKIRYSK